MAEDLLVSIDKAFETPRRKLRPKRAPAPAPAVAEAPSDAAAGSDARTTRERLPWLELFLVAQCLWGALLFLPGAQSYRTLIRALPYVSSVGMLAVYGMSRETARRPRASGLLAAALLLLALNLLHPTSQLVAGFAQCLLQLCIAAPLFWAYKVLNDPKRFERGLMLLFLMNLASAAVGILQVYYPDYFMPPQLSTRLSEEYLYSLSYVGNDGRVIFRPPGLSDQPGGASIAGGFAVLLGLGIMLRTDSLARRGLLLASIVLGMAVIYLTQVRSVLLMVLAAGGVLSLVQIRQQRLAAATGTLAMGGVLALAGFFWASSVGGEVISNRFMNLRSQGVLQTYQQDRGHYLSNTFGELLDKYPLGAGVGRWGMMNTYFGDESDPNSPPIYVEPQVTGWLLDGGIPMWVFYGGAVLLSIFAAFELVGGRHAAAAEFAGLTLPVLVFVAGLGMAGPIFNTQTGIIFWLLAAGVEGTARTYPGLISPARNSRSYEREASEGGRA